MGKPHLTPAEIKDMRKKMGKTQAQLADDLGISASALSDYEQGKNRKSGEPRAIPKAIALAIRKLCDDASALDWKESIMEKTLTYHRSNNFASIDFTSRCWEAIKNLTPDSKEKYDQEYRLVNEYVSGHRVPEVDLSIALRKLESADCYLLRIVPLDPDYRHGFMNASTSWRLIDPSGETVATFAAPDDGNEMRTGPSELAGRRFETRNAARAAVEAVWTETYQPPQISFTDNLIADVEFFMLDTRVKPAELGVEVANDPDWVSNLKTGKPITLHSAQNAMAFMEEFSYGRSRRPPLPSTEDIMADIREYLATNSMSAKRLSLKISAKPTLIDNFLRGGTVDLATIDRLVAVMAGKDK